MSSVQTAILFPGQGAAQPQAAGKGRNQQPAGAPEGHHGICPHGDRPGAVDSGPEGSDQRQTHQQRQTGQPQHRHQQQPAEPLPVGNVKYQGPQQGPEVCDPILSHRLSGGGVPPWHPECPAAPDGRFFPGPLPGEKAGSGGQWSEQRPPAHPRGSHNPGPGAEPRPLPWR